MRAHPTAAPSSPGLACRQPVRLLLTAGIGSRTTVGRDESLDEGQRLLRHLPPAVVDRERMAPIRDLLELGDALVPPLTFVGRLCDRRVGGVVLLAFEDQQRPRSVFVVSTF